VYEPVVITGIGVCSPIGSGYASFADAVLSGTSALAPITDFDPAPVRARHAGVIATLAETPVPASTRQLGTSVSQLMRKMDRVTKLAVLAAEDARADAGLDLADVPANRIGIILGTAFDGLVTIEEYYRAVVVKGPKHASPALFPFTLPNSINGAVSIHMGIKGVNSSLATGTVSGLASVGYALDLLRADRADVIFTGGADVFGEPILRALDFLGLVSPKNGGREGAWPFGEGRNGFVMGEASAFLVLERRAHAIARGARIHAELAGYSNTFDGYKWAENDPTGGGICKAMANALADAGRTSADVDYIAASANSSPTGDRAEARGIRTLLGERADSVPVSSIKGMTGETFSAGGVLSLITGVAAIQRGAIPPNMHGAADPAPLGDDVPLGCVPHAMLEHPVRVALANSVCYTGNNASAVVTAG
jgi:3-oxoacyl-[acyl-carrier-protein] synthase II